MGTQQDFQIMGVAESTYGVAVTTTRTLEFIEEDFDYQPEFVQGAGMRVGKKVQRADRNATGKTQVGGSVTVEGYTKGQGWLWQAALGSGTSTLISGAAYQQVFSLGSGDYLPSYTIQTGAPLLGGGAAQPHTFTGMTCSGFEFTAGNAGIPTIKFNFAGKDVATGTALATAAYPASTGIYSFVGAALTIGGVITPPTTTALATSTGTLGLANIREFDLTWDNALDTEGFNFNGGGKRSRNPALGLRVGTGSFTAEFTDTALEQAWLNRTDLGLLLTFQMPNVAGNLISGSAYPTLQIAIPNIKVGSELVKSAGGDVMTQSVSYEVFDNGTASSPIYVAIVTAETAI